MSGTFAGLNIALSALRAQRLALDVTGQNVANANTAGYSRQRVNMSAVAGPGTAGVPSSWTPGGVETGQVTRLRDAIADTRARSEHATGGYLDVQKTVYDQVEQIVGEPSDTGLQSQLTDFWAAWHDVANNPGDLPTRSQLLGEARTVAGTLQRAGASIGSLWATTRQQASAQVSEVNSTASAVADLNRQVRQATQIGLPVNELADRRDQLVMRLSELTGATTAARDDGTVDVMVGGSALVSGALVRQLSVTGATDLNNLGALPVSVQWADGSPASVPSGGLAGSLEALVSTIPAQSAAFDQVAAALASTVNAQHAAGFDLSGAPGGPLFTGSTAAGLQVAITDPARLAVSATGGALDAGNADALAGLGTLPTGPDVVYRQYVADLGTASAAVQRRVAVQTATSAAADNSVDAESGVSLDEEMTNMLQFQRAYEAASRVLTTMDDVLDTLINHTGVG